MQTNLMFIGWNRAVTGREGAAGENFQQLLGYLGKQQAAGGIESFEPVFLTMHGGDLNGFILVRGENKNLNALRTQEDFVALIMQCGLNVEGFGVLDGYGGEALQTLMGKWMQMTANN